jgi:uncharacterized membrane protein YbhN (UPF0104 family)
VLQGLVGLALAVTLLGWGLPYFSGTSWGDIVHTMEQVGWGTAGWLFALMVLGLWLYTFTLTGSLPGLTHAKALTVNVAGSAVGNLLPGGGAAGVAVTYAMCRSWGFSRRDISTSIIVSGVWNVMARVALPVLGVLVLVLGSSPMPRAVSQGGVVGAIGALLLLGVFIAIIASERAATRIGHFLSRLLRPISSRIRRGPTLTIDELIHDLRARITAVVGSGWLPMTTGVVGFFGVYCVLFWGCLSSVGVHMPFAELFAAYAVGRLLTAVGVTPGGVGVTETGTVAVVIAWGADPTAAAAGVVLFSIYTHLLEIPLGALGGLSWSLARRPAPRLADTRLTDSRLPGVAGSPATSEREQAARSAE